MGKKKVADYPGKAACRRRAVPMLYAGKALDYIPFVNDLYWLSPIWQLPRFKREKQFG